MPFDTSEILFEEAEKLGLRFVLCRGTATHAAAGGGVAQCAAAGDARAALSDMQRLAKALP
jgi:hypothetical protein